MGNKRFFILIIIIGPFLANAQQIGKESYSYEVNKSQVYMYEIDKRTEIPDFKKLWLAEQYLFNKVGEYHKKDSQNQSTIYYKFKLVSFKNKNLIIEPLKWCETFSKNLTSGDKSDKTYRCAECNNLLKPEKFSSTDYDYYEEKDKKCIRKVKKTKDYIIDRDDFDKVFIIESGRFDKHETNNEVVKRYTRTFKPTYGSSFSVPFKFRPSVNEEPLRIAPSFTLGAYLGAKWRMHRYSAVYLVPTITLGVTSIDINESTVTGDAPVSDGQILARTASLGLIAQIDKFQIGAVIGWDKPGGDAGKNWVYNDRVWYSFQIGFDFLNLSGDAKDK
ncbi:hypothetical protein N9954_07960 [Maribacter sp.]|nr:hypothetical protein [Maribacter sp.]